MATGAAPAAIAKGALRRLAQAQQEPTPENYARAYADEAGVPMPAAADARAQGAAWVALVDQLSRQLERGGRQWTAARRKESLRRVLDGSRSDPSRLLQRLQSLMGAWEGDTPLDVGSDGADGVLHDADGVPAAEGRPADPAAGGAWPGLVAALESTVRSALPPAEPTAAELAARLQRLAAAVAADGATPALAAEIDAVCAQARPLLAHRHRLVDELSALCRELGAGLADLAEDDSWARGQCDALQARLADGASVRAVRAAGALLAETRERQRRLRGDRRDARDAIKQLLHDMLIEVGEIGEHTGRFHVATQQHAQAIAGAETIEGLAGVVQALLVDARTVQVAVSSSQQRLQADHARAGALEDKVRELEGELQRLSEEVSTDALTQVANRRGLLHAFEAESARAARDAASGAAAPLAVGLIDIDNFKKLNDTLGHAAGDVALQALAAAVRERLRPGDHLARYGGEEFVVLLPGTALDEALQALTRLQRGLTEALFLHEGREVFVTFSAGVTAWRPGEDLQPALERADTALYDAKRSGKNRTCAG